MDPPERNRAMVDKLLLPFSLLSDQDGVAIKRYGFWNEDEGTARPAIVVIGPDAVVRYVYQGRDFADRPGDDVVVEALQRNGR